MNKGQTVKFKHPLTENEAKERFTVLELRGPRVLVQVQNSGFSAGLVPTAVYLKSDLIEVPDLQATIQRMKSEVLEYIAQGRIPATVSSFGELHDYIDANTLGGFCEDNGITDTLIQMHGGRDDDEGMPDQVIQYMNDAQDAIHAWLEAGGHKGIIRYAVHVSNGMDFYLKTEKKARALAIKEHGQYLGLQIVPINNLPPSLAKKYYKYYK